MGVHEEISGPVVLCRQPGCGHGFPEHGPGGGSCADGCPCPGFRWVPARGPAVGYHQPPQWPGELDQPAVGAGP
jgi:hypothetical protein